MKIHPLIANQKGIYDVILYLPDGDDIRDEKYIELKTNELPNTNPSKYYIQIESKDGQIVSWYHIDRYAGATPRITKDNAIKYVYWLTKGR